MQVQGDENLFCFVLFVNIHTKNNGMEWNGMPWQWNAMIQFAL